MRLLLWSLIALANTAVAGTPDLSARLAQALRCEGEPAGVIDWLDPLVGKAHPEAVIVASGEDLDYRVDVQLKQPLLVAGARTGTVTWQVDGGHAGFGGVVFAEFEGEAASVVGAWSLRPDANEDGMGAFRREVPDGSACPPTILLTPTRDGRFLLGCGWCNG